MKMMILSAIDSSSGGRVRRFSGSSLTEKVARQKGRSDTASRFFPWHVWSSFAAICLIVFPNFGLCLLADDEERQTGLDEAVGSRYFMAPEFEDGKIEDVTANADVYSLGKLLYWLVSGGKNSAGRISVQRSGIWPTRSSMTSRMGSIPRWNISLGFSTI